MTKEIWKNIIGYEGSYQVSNLGRVKSLARKKSNQYNSFDKKEMILKPRYSTKGYIHAMLYKDGKSKSFCVHRLVLSAFDRLPKGKEQCNHINGIKDDNRLENLEWTNNSDNQLHAFRMGLNKPRRGEDNNKSKLTGKQVKEVRKDYKFGVKGFGATILAKKYNVSKQAILKIVRNEHWKHL